MSDWDADLYRRFEAERTRPAIELLARVTTPLPRRIVDLGCGPGNSTELLVARWPSAEIVGVDSSPAMIEAARARLPRLRFVEADLESFEEQAELLFANAVLQWSPDHEVLIPRLFGRVAPGGTLAFQMPDNLEEPSHRAMRAVARDFASRDTARARILPAEAYYDLLANEAVEVDVFRTTYHHVMPSAAAIVDWLRATGLRPYLAPLDDHAQRAFLTAYEAAIDAAYPPRVDGTRLLVFPRLFVVARRR
jgi:trans-aconitate 2-methyltransferase